MAGWLLAAVLAVRLLVPAGYMPVQDGARTTIMICSGMAAMQRSVALPGKHEPAKPGGGVCAFAGMGPLAAAGVAIAVVAATISFTLALRTAPPATPAVRRIARTRPPPIGPPAFA